MYLDLLDEAFATLHIGIIGLDHDIFKLVFCFHMDLQYDRNILKVNIIPGVLY